MTNKQPSPLHAADGIVALNPSLLIMSANHVVRWIIGHEPKPGKVFPFDKLFHEPDLTRIRAALNFTLETGQPSLGMTCDLHTDSGGTFPCGYGILPMLDISQRITGILFIFQRYSDSHASLKTEKKRQTLRHTPPESEILIEELPEGVFTITTHWRISSFNKTAETITGFKREEVIGKYCWEIFRSNKCKVSCPLRRALDSGQSAMDQEVRIVDKKGVRQAMLVNTNVLRDATGLVLGAVETFRPLTGEIHPPDGVECDQSFADIVGRSESMQRIFKIIPDIAASDANVLICGESGTGKDLIARAIHNYSLRSKGPYIAVNCSALAETLLESELFGHEKSAFTGADRAKSGRFEIARGGSIFLDEIGELRAELQVKLLRVLEQREFERVGGTQLIPMDARIISATNKNLQEAIQNGTFRRDFYYRLRTVPITLPPLRERKEDIPLLVNHFIKRFNKRYNKNVRSADTKVMRFFQNYHFPGNVRELERAIEYAYVFVKGPVIFMSNLPAKEEFQLPEDGNADEMNMDKQNHSREAILRALAKSSGKRQQAAEMLGMSRTSLWRAIKKWNLN
ncbi:MAG: sigma 54-interacting transcriptional regulator [Proteobacteria bacterium]|nr:sigma 54-interacting transcriptional regulator [Pseudomonadota bacterium]